jgi:hypothetical protein
MYVQWAPWAVQSDSWSHGVFTAFEHSPRQVPAPQFPSEVQAVALLLLQKPLQVLPLPQSSSWSQDLGAVVEQ